MKIAIIDYKMGNLFSVKQACKHVGMEPLITSDEKEIANADGVILPGVGAFGQAMHNLGTLNLIDPIKHVINMGKPFMGICLGFQLLFTVSEEFGATKGLGVVEGEVLKLPQSTLPDKQTQKIKIPHIGWNQISLNNAFFDKKNNILKDIEDGEFMYFVHSYFVKPAENTVILSNTTYHGFEYCSSILKDNLFAAQFHPEKSGKKGLKIYSNWLNYIKTN